MNNDNSNKHDNSDNLVEMLRKHLDGWKVGNVDIRVRRKVLGMIAAPTPDLQAFSIITLLK
jgi:hypothetical protein